MTNEKQVKTHHETSVYEQMPSTNQRETQDVHITEKLFEGKCVPQDLKPILEHQPYYIMRVE